jgi:hypothetical protein
MVAGAKALVSDFGRRLFFLLIGAYWLTTGEKFDETAYRLILCQIYNFVPAVQPA